MPGSDRYAGLDLKVFDAAKHAGYLWVRAGHDKHREPYPRPEGYDDWSTEKKNSWLCGFMEGVDVLWRPRYG